MEKFEENLWWPSWIPSNRVRLHRATPKDPKNIPIQEVENRLHWRNAKIGFKWLHSKWRRCNPCVEWSKGNNSFLLQNHEYAKMEPDRRYWNDFGRTGRLGDSISGVHEREGTWNIWEDLHKEYHKYRGNKCRRWSQVREPTYKSEEGCYLYGQEHLR